MGGGLYILRLSPKHFYGGRTQDFRGRWKIHLWELEHKRHKNRYMQAIFNKHGVFEPEVVLELESEAEQILAEQLWLDEYHGTEGCVNLSKSSDTGGMRGRKHSAETRALLCLKRQGRVFTLATRKAIGDAHRGKKCGPHTPETRQKISEALKGRPLTEAHRQNLSEALKGKSHPCSPETRVRIMLSSIGSKRSEAHRKAISEGHKGLKMPAHCGQITAQANRDRVWTEESRKKLSESHKGLVKSPEAIQKQKDSWRAKPGQVERARAQFMKNRLPVGHKMSPETCQIMSEAAKRRWESPESRKLLSEAAKGRVWIHDGEVSKFLFPDAAQAYLEQGWLPGRPSGWHHKKK